MGKGYGRGVVSLRLPTSVMDKHYPAPIVSYRICSERFPLMPAPFATPPPREYPPMQNTAKRHTHATNNRDLNLHRRNVSHGQPRAPPSPIPSARLLLPPAPSICQTSPERANISNHHPASPPPTANHQTLAPPPPLTTDAPARTQAASPSESGE